MKYREGEEWKRIRTAIGKQATPRNVQTYHTGFNATFERFMDSIRGSLRSKDGVVEDVTLPLNLLFMESE